MSARYTEIPVIPSLLLISAGPLEHTFKTELGILGKLIQTRCFHSKRWCQALRIEPIPRLSRIRINRLKTGVIWFCLACTNGVFLLHRFTSVVRFNSRAVLTCFTHRALTGLKSLRVPDEVTGNMLTNINDSF